MLTEGLTEEKASPSALLTGVWGERKGGTHHFLLERVF